MALTIIGVSSVVQTSSYLPICFSGRLQRLVDVGGHFIASSSNSVI